MIRKFILSISVLSLAPLLSCQYEEYLTTEYTTPQSPEIILRLADNHDENSYSKSCEYFAEKVTEKSDGRIKILCYNNSNFGDNSSVFQQVKLGGIDLAEIPCTVIAETEEEFNVLSLPYIYNDNEHMKNVLEGNTGKYFLNHQQLKNNDIYGLCWYASETRNFYSPYNFDNGIENLKISTEKFPVLEDTLSCLGAVPVTAGHEEIFPMLVNGNTDIAEGTLSSYVQSDYYESAPYIFLDEHCVIPEMLVISKSTMDNLSAEYQTIIRECAEESAQQHYLFLEEMEKNAYEEIKKHNCTVIEPSEEQKKQLKDAVTTLKEEYRKKYNDTIEKIENNIS